MGLLNCPECPTRPAIEDFPTKHACWKYYFAFENNFRFSPVFNTAHTLTPVICQLNYFLGSSRYCTYISTYIHPYTCDTYTIFISNKLFCLFDLAKKYHGCKTLAIETIADDSQCLQHKVGINKTQKWVIVEVTLKNFPVEYGGGSFPTKGGNFYDKKATITITTTLGQFL